MTDVTTVTTPGAHIAGTSGSDWLYGTGGNDVYYGGGGNDAFIISAASLAASASTTNGIGGEAVIYDFGGAGGWSATNNDFISLIGFGAGSTMTFDHASAANPTMQWYDIHDTATGNTYQIYVHSLDGQQLSHTGGDFAFY